MTPAMVLAQTGSVATWVNAISGLGVITVTIIAYRRDRRRYMAERRDREAEQLDQEAAQARLVTIEVNYKTPAPNGSTFNAVTITNGSRNPVLRPRIESMGQAGVRSGHQGLVDEEGEEYWQQPRVVLQPHEVERVLFEHFDAAGRSISFGTIFMTDTLIHVDDVTFTFGMSVRWRRTGNREPVRVFQPALGTE